MLQVLAVDTDCLRCRPQRRRRRVPELASKPDPFERQFRTGERRHSLNRTTLETADGVSLAALKNDPASAGKSRERHSSILKRVQLLLIRLNRQVTILKIHGAPSRQVALSAGWSPSRKEVTSPAGSSWLGRACHGPSSRCQRCVRIQFDPTGADSHTQLLPELLEVHHNRGILPFAIQINESGRPCRSITGLENS